LQLQGNLTVGQKLTIQGSGAGTTSLPSIPVTWIPLSTGTVNASTNGTAQAPNDAAVSGDVTSVAVAPDDPNTIYIATGGGGAWKTINDGLTWTQIFDAT